jgi:hypothetical protein
MARKHSPFNNLDTRRGSVVAVEFQQGLWCYVREYLLSHAFLPFFSRVPLDPSQLPSLRGERHFDLWCYDADDTPMKFIGRFPFDTPDEMHGEAFYTPPDVIDRCFRIHEAVGGVSLLRKTFDPTEVQSLRRQRRYQPKEFYEFLGDRLNVWPTIPS